VELMRPVVAVVRIQGVQKGSINGRGGEGDSGHVHHLTSRFQIYSPPRRSLPTYLSISSPLPPLPSPQ
jgi:hypothetical protein